MNTFDDWYAEHSRRLLAKANSMLGGDLQTAQDICSMAWAKAWQARERYDGRPVGPWLNTILRRTLIDYGRRRRLPTLQDQDEPVDKRAAVCRLEIAELVERVDALPTHLALAVRAVYLDRKSVV